MTSDSADVSPVRVWHAIAQIVAAHLTMLRDVQILDEAALESLLSAVESVREASPAATSLHAMVCEFDERMDALSPPEVRAAGQVGRGTNDVVATTIRILLRTELAEFFSALVDCRTAFVDLADQHLVSLVPAFAGGRPAQPTTLAHMLGGVIGPLERAAARLESAYASVNRSPMGAVSLASTGFEIDPARTADLLGFTSPVDNSYDAVSSVDHLVESVDAVSAGLSPLRRLIGELLHWLRAEPDSFQFSDDSTERDPAMPQFQMPTRLTEIERGLAGIERELTASKQAILAIPFGPVTGPDSGILLGALDNVGAARTMVENVSQLISHDMRVHRAVLANRAGRGMITSSDLADFLMIEEQLPPSAARAIANRTIAVAREEGREASGITPELIDSAALLILGRELRVEFETIRRYLAPRRFIERRALPGGPAPSAMRAYLQEARLRLDEDRRWLERVEAAISEGQRLPEGEAVSFPRE